MKLESILEVSGNTPCVKLGRLFPQNEVWLKMESLNPGGSIKDRVAIKMIEGAERKKIINQNTVIIEPTSGNTGIGLAMVCAVKGYDLIIVMPDSLSEERKKTIAAYGAKLVLTPGREGMRGAIHKAESLAKEINPSWIPYQFKNPDNPLAHIETTALEILDDFPNRLDYMVAGIGTGGHISGCGIELKKKYPNLNIIGVEPESSAFLSGNEPGPHMIQGIGAGFKPDILNMDIIDEIYKVSNEKAYEFTRKCAKKEGIFIGISTGAVIAAVSDLLKNIHSEDSILCFCYDSGNKYLSVKNLF